MKKIIIFDVDGTLVDTEEALFISLQELVEEDFNITVPMERLSKYFGTPGKRILGDVGYHELTDDELTAKHKQWSERTNERSGLIKIFPDLLETIIELKERGAFIGVITSKNANSYSNMMRFFPELEALLDLVITSDMTVNHKPEADPFLLFMKRYEEAHSPIDVSDYLYVGDTIFDNQGAHAAGMEFALATWGANPDQEFNADYRLINATELLDI